MAIEQGLLQLIGANASVTALIPNDVAGHPQIYWNLAPKGAKNPYIVLDRVGTSDTYTTAGATVLRDGLFAVHCYADSKAGVSSGYYTNRQIAKAVRNVLKSYKGTLSDADLTVVQAVFIEKDWNLPYQEGATGFVFHAYLEFRVWYVDNT